jgi:hypothetical protein
VNEQTFTIDILPILPGLFVDCGPRTGPDLSTEVRAMARTAAEYLEEAEECLRMAARMEEQEQQEAWLMMASAFQRQAAKTLSRERDARLPRANVNSLDGYRAGQTLGRRESLPRQDINGALPEIQSGPPRRQLKHLLRSFVAGLRRNSSARG